MRTRLLVLLVLVGAACDSSSAPPATSTSPSAASAYHLVRASIQTVPFPVESAVVVEGYLDLPPDTETLVPDAEPFASRFLVDGLRTLAGRPFGPGRSDACELRTATGALEPGPWSPARRTFSVSAPAGTSCLVEPFSLDSLGVVFLNAEEARSLAHAEGNAVARFLADHRERVEPLRPVAVTARDAPTVAAVRDAVMAQADAFRRSGRRCDWAVRPGGVAFTDSVRGTVKVHVGAATGEVDVPFDFSRGADRALGADLSRYCRAA